MRDELVNQEFLSPTRGKLAFSGVIDDIVQEVEGGFSVRISVGTDSEEIASEVKYVTIVHLWRVGRGARAFRTITWEGVRNAEPASKERFRQRIWKEILLTATLAQEVRSALRDSLSFSPLCDAIEVHADVGENGKSSTMIREVIGMLKGYGFLDEFIKLKPEAYAASAVADHYI